MGSVRGRALMDLVKGFGWGGKAGTQLQTTQLWDKIYESSSGDYEWGCKPDQFLAYDYRYNGFSMYATLNDTLPPGSPVLMIGAGASLLGEAIYDNDYQPVVQTDFSEVVVKRRRSDMDIDLRPQMYWECVDAREPMTHLLQHIQDKDPKHAIEQHDKLETKFGAVVDKGLIDGLYLAGGESMEDIPKVVSRVAEVLTPGKGVFVTLSYSSPNIITPLLKNKHFTSIEARLMEAADIYLYRMSRGDI